MPRPSPIVLIAASIVGLVSLGVVGGLIFLVGSAWFGLPVGAQGPDQPIAYPHTVHAGAIEDGGLGLDCTFCHRNVARGAAATIPSLQQCMFCHITVDGTTDTAKQEIDILQEAFANNQPINWTRVHRLPDHVEFVHDAHIRFLTDNPGEIVNATNLTISLDGTVNASQTCSTCHGDVENMVKVKQVRALKMGDCVDCHRQYQAPTDCATCHY
jgi:hypothetical protein